MSSDSAQVVFWRVNADGGRTGIIGLGAPIQLMTPEPGARVQVQYATTGLSWVPQQTVVVRVDDELRFYSFGSARISRSADFEVPEISFARGNEVCEDSDECGSWSQYTLMATAEGKTVEVGWTSTKVGSFSVRGSWSEDDASNQCADWNHDGAGWFAYR
ncbi:MAG: hypothetical protein HY791_08460 [Deltaproteobacteria bacterium]|nr:hypothetical protein [Deltaproteobacteria bacterium]